jgi:hypothetical protein
MVFFHVVADYNLQGWLATAKQKSFWKENAPEKLYEYDYICALIMHSISWTFLVMLPIAYVQDFNVGFVYILLFILNVIVHAIVDHMKANDKTINLWVDQILHFVQMFITAGWLLFAV